MTDDVVKFPGPDLPIERYDGEDNLRHAEHFRCLHSRIDDCAIMSFFAMEEMEKAERANVGSLPRARLAFAVYHLAEMVQDLQRHYHAAYKGEVEP